MGLQCIPNQPIDFCTHVNQSCVCGPTGLYRGSVSENDVTEFQFNITPSANNTANDLSTACGVNWNCGAGWSINTVSEVASYSGAGAGIFDTTLFAVLNTGVYYRITFDINPTTTSGASLIPTLGGNNIKQIGFNSLIPGIWQTVTIYVYLNTKSDDKVGFNPGATPAFDIRNITVQEMTTAIPIIEDSDGNALYTFTPDAATFTGVTNVYPAPNIYQINDSVASNPIEVYYRGNLCMVKILDWALLGIAYGCVQIKIKEAVTPFNTWTSSPLDYRESHECSLLLSWTAGEDMFGFNHVLDFTMYLRIKAKLWHPRYVYDDEEQYTNSEGVTNQIYAYTYKLYEFVTEHLPEYVHDALRIGLIHSDFYVDSVRMTKDEGDYSPQWNKNYNLSSVSFDLKQADPGRLNAHRLCNAVGVGGDAVGTTVVL